MKNRKLKFFTVFAAALLLTACNQDNESSRNHSKDQQTNLSSTSEHSVSSSLESESLDESTVSNEKVATFEIESVQDYSDDVAWVKINKKEDDVIIESQWACIDKTGKVLFMLDAGLYTTPGAFENSVSLCEAKRDVFNYIDKTGNVVFSSKEGLFDGVIISPYDEVASGDGYFAVYKYQESFDTKGYEVFFLNEKGEDVYAYNELFNEIPELIYCGDGVFANCTWRSAGSTKGYDFISLKTNTLFHVLGINGYYDLSNIFVNNIGLVEMGSGRMSDSDPALIYLDGTVVKLDITGYAYYDYGKISDNGFVFTSYDTSKKVKSCCFYNIATEKVTLLGDYGERVNIKRLEDLYFDNGCMLLPLVGADRKNYYTIMDKSGQSLFDPIVCNGAYALNEDRIMVKYDDKTVIINGNGEIIFELPLNCEITPYQSGMAQIAGDEQNIFIDTEGNVLSADDILHAVEDFFS